MPSRNAHVGADDPSVEPSGGVIPPVGRTQREAARESGTVELADPFDRAIIAQLDPFVAWLATRDLGEAAAPMPTRGRAVPGVEPHHRCRPGRRQRYEQHLRQDHSDQLPAVRAGLDRWAEHHALIARTLPRND